MNKLTLSIFAMSAMLAASSCSYKDKKYEEGSSTPIDSTNVEGTAPAQYGPESDTSYPVYEGQHDTNLKSNTKSSEDSAKNRK